MLVASCPQSVVEEKSFAIYPPRTTDDQQRTHAVLCHVIVINFGIH
jgi:hypothetical protein